MLQDIFVYYDGLYHPTNFVRLPYDTLYMCRVYLCLCVCVRAYVRACVCARGWGVIYVLKFTYVYIRVE